VWRFTSGGGEKCLDPQSRTADGSAHNWYYIDDVASNACRAIPPPPPA
jgi:hypothetical protein